MFKKKPTQTDILIEAITNHVRVTLKEAIEHDFCVLNDVHFNRSANGEYLISISLTKQDSAVTMVNLTAKDFNLDLESGND